MVAIAATSKNGQFHGRQTKTSSLRKKQRDIGRTSTESVDLKPKQGPKVSSKLAATDSRKRPLQTAKGTGLAAHQGAHFSVDSRKSLTHPGEHAVEERKNEHGRGRLRGRKEDRAQSRSHKVPSSERTETQSMKPGSSKGRKLQQEAVGRRTTLKRYNTCNTCEPSRV